MKSKVPAAPAVEDAFEAARKAFFSSADSKPKPAACHTFTRVKTCEAPAARKAAPAADRKAAETEKHAELAPAH